MKKLTLIFTTLLLSTVLWAQNDVTEFLGIPVDGLKSEMIRKLKAKGFTEHSYKPDVLVGEYAGRDVEVYIFTNNDKVYRICLSDKSALNETDIKIRFNTLCSQFTNDEEYMSLSESDQAIPKDEDISDEMSVNNKRYKAVFFQVPESLDKEDIRRKVMAKVMEEYSEEQLNNASIVLKTEIIDKVLKYTVAYTYQIIQNKTVWFTIDNDGDSYRILTYYDNMLNQANGEDLYEDL